MSEEVKREPVDNSHRDAGIAARDAKREAEKTEIVEEAAVVAEEAIESEGEQGESKNDTEESAGSDRDDAPAQPHRKKKPGVHERIKELTTEKYEERRLREAAERELKELRQKLDQPAQPRKEEGEKTLEDFAWDTAAYGRYLREQAREEAVRAAKEYQEQQEQQRETQKAADAFKSRLDAFEAQNPGAWESAIRAPINYTEAMLEVVKSSDHGPAIAHYLAQNLDQADSISRMTPYAAAAALGRIESAISAPPSQPQAKPVTRAPAPVTTLSGAPAVKKPYDEMSMREYDEARRKERAAKGLSNR